MKIIFFLYLDSPLLDDFNKRKIIEIQPLVTEKLVKNVQIIKGNQNYLVTSKLKKLIYLYKYNEK